MKQFKRSSSQTRQNERYYEDLEDKLYRLESFLPAHQQSIASFAQPKPQRRVPDYSKHFQSKDLSDIVESLTGAVFMNSGLYAAHQFCKYHGITDDEIDLYYLHSKLDRKYQKMNLRENEAIVEFMDSLKDEVGIRLRNENLFQVAVTHKSYNQVQLNFDFESYERLEYLGDSIHKYFIVE